VNENSAAPGVLIVTGLEGIESIASALASALGLAVEIASARAAGLRLLGRRSYSAVVVDQLLADADPEGAALLWKQAGLAVPLELNFAIASPSRLEREIRAALSRREREQQVASRAVAAAADSALKNAVTGILLESELALSEAGIPPQLQARLEHLASMAAQLRNQLGAPPFAESAGGSAAKL